MNTTIMRKALAIASLMTIAACGGGGGGSGAVVPPHTGGGTSAPLLSRIVGVGDSLTAGYQSDGMLGATGVPDPYFSPSPSQTAPPVPPTQEQGYWADVDEQASGLPLSTAIAQMFDPATSPLPLIAGPGINNQLVPYPGLAGFQPDKANSCTDDNGFDAAGYLLGASKRVRMNPTSSTIRNVAVPGITLHEANVLTEPQSNTCKALPGIRGLLQQVVDGESSTYWPVLRNFANMGQQLTMVNAAAKLKPTLALVWLGANDVLKYMGSGGLFHGGDSSAGQAAADERQAINTLKHAGAKIVVANLPNILETPYFMRATIPPSSSNVCNYQTYAVCVMGNVFGSFALATQLVTQMANQYHLATPGGCQPTSTSNPCGYLTLQGTFTALQYYQAHQKLPDLDNGHPGSGLGMFYITPAFAAKVQALNDAINGGIDMAAQQTNSPLVNVQTIFSGIASGKRSNPYFRQAISIGARSQPCCTLAFEGGLVSFDGLHPSNSGYALLAYAFIATINGAYGTTIPQIDVNAVWAGTRCSNPNYCYPDPYSPGNIL